MRFAGPGGDTDEALLVAADEDTVVRLSSVRSDPVLSALRRFSAPVELKAAGQADDAYVLLASDTDLFNRWEAGQTLATQLILARLAGSPDETGERRWAEAVGRGLADQSADAAFKALLLSPPGEADLALKATPLDPQALHDAREALRATLGRTLAAALTRLHDELADGGAFSADAEAAGRRALRNAALHLLVSARVAAAVEQAQAHFEAADNMTDALGGLEALSRAGGEPYEAALAAFYDRWKDEPLVVDKWFALQASSTHPETLEHVKALADHPDFTMRNPNRVRSLYMAFAYNPHAFHAESGEGYRMIADVILALDPINPQTAARFVPQLGRWRRIEPKRSAMMKEQLERIAAAPKLSRDTYEQVSRSLG